MCRTRNGAGELSSSLVININFCQQCEYYQSTRISLFRRKAPSKVTLGQVQLKWFMVTLRGNALNTLSTICVEHMVNELPRNLLNLARWSMYSVVAAHDFLWKGFSEKRINLFKGINRYIKQTIKIYLHVLLPDHTEVTRLV